MRATTMLFLAATLPFAIPRVSAQDPVKLSPHLYTVLVDNEHVRVLEFRAKAGDKEPMHHHPAGLVYLVTTGKTRMTTPDGQSQEREWAPGTAVWIEPTTHAYENLGPGAARVLIVEVKSLTASKGSASSAAETQSARAELITRTLNFARWLDAGRLDSLASLVTDDYQALAPNQPAVVGKTAWVDWSRRLLTLGRWTEELTTESIEVSGPLAVHRGRYTLRFAPAATAPAGTVAMSDAGKFLWHWRKVGDEWRLAAAAWSSDLPSSR